MSQNKIGKFGPIALTTTLTTNLLNPDATSGGVNDPATGTFMVLTRLTIVNKTGSAATASLWIGATGGNAAGTEFWVQAQSVPANSSITWYGRRRLDVADFLVGGAGTTTALTIEGDFEQGVA